MNVLAIDTAGHVTGVGLYDAARGRMRRAVSWHSQRRQTTELAVHVQSLMRTLDMRIDCIDLLAVSTGPGSTYTGVRIGLSLAKGMSQGRTPAIPLVGVSSLSLLLDGPYRLARQVAPEALLVGVLPAGRGNQLWTALAAAAPWQDPAAGDLEAGPDAEFMAWLDARVADHPAGDIWICGPLSPALRTQVDAMAGVVCLHEDPAVHDVARLAARAWRDWRREPAVAAPGRLTPFYVSPL